MANITYFHGQYRWLSNFWTCRVIFSGEEYKSVECAYVAAKTFDKDARKEIALMTASQAKRFGHKLELRHDWEDIKLYVMDDLLRQKFAAGSVLAKKLLDTGNVIIMEGNSWGDKFWGVCDGEGDNHLGRLLMKIRDDLLIVEKERCDD